jgi:hypothetical protein
VNGAEVNEERECKGYIKEPPKAGGRWGILTKNRLTPKNVTKYLMNY